MDPKQTELSKMVKLVSNSSFFFNINGSADEDKMITFASDAREHIFFIQ